MTATYRLHATAVGSNAGSAACNVPAGTTNGDVMIAVVTTWTSSGSAGTHTTHASWNLITSVTKGSGRQSTYWRIASSEPASYTFAWSISTSIGYALAITSYSGGAAASPIDVSASNSGNSSTAATTAVTTTVADTKLVATFGHTGGSFSQPTGMAERYEVVGTGTNGPSTALDDETIAATGSTGTRSSTLGYGDDWLALAQAIKPGTSSQDAPESRGRPFGLRGAMQMGQLIAQ